MTRSSSPISWRPALTVFRKECKDHLRDKRSIILSFVFPLLAPIVLGLLLSSLGTRGQDSVDRSGINVPVAGAEYAPKLVDYLIAHVPRLTGNEQTPGIEVRYAGDIFAAAL